MDLKEERQAVISALLQLNAIPSGMELFPAADDDAWTLIQRVIDDCDYYLLVVGGKYGSIDPDEHVSYTEKEYDYAVSQRKPVMAFLHGRPDDIPSGKTERTEEAQRLLAAFRSKVERSKHVKHWMSAEQLAGQVALSFAQFTNQYPAIGWIRADQVAASDALLEINDLRRELAAAKNLLDVERTTPPPGTEDLAQGDDQFDIVLDMKCRYRIKGGSAELYDHYVELAPRWDDLFAGVSDRLLDECAEHVLRERLNRWLLEDTWFKFRGELLQRLNEERSEDKRRVPIADEDLHTYGFEATLDNDQFGTILVQFMALGLIQKSQKPRSVRDTGTYWSLTPYGETRTIQLRAIRKDGSQGIRLDEDDLTSRESDELAGNIEGAEVEDVRPSGPVGDEDG